MTDVITTVEELGGDVLLIVPPFTLANRPNLSLHLLQACAEEEN